MGKWYRGLFVAILCVAATGCVERAPTLAAADVAAMVQSGRALLNCREACLAEWRRVQPQAAQSDDAGRWPELAAAVLQTRFEDDLSLYYLGRAAEGLGYPAAAASYYRQSLRLSGTSASCLYLSRTCGGVALPRAATLRLAAIDRRIYTPPRRRPATGLALPAPPPELPGGGLSSEPVEAVAPAPAGTAPPWAEASPSPIPPPAAVPAAATPTAPAHSPGTASEFIEPPPAR